MGITDDITDTIEDIDFGKVMASINIAKGLIEAGYKIMELLSDKQELSNLELLEIIEGYNTSKDEARRLLIEAIKAERAN